MAMAGDSPLLLYVTSTVLAVPPRVGRKTSFPINCCGVVTPRCARAPGACILPNNITVCSFK